MRAFQTSTREMVGASNAINIPPPSELGTASVLGWREERGWRYVEKVENEVSIRFSSERCTPPGYSEGNLIAAPSLNFWSWNRLLQGRSGMDRSFRGLWRNIIPKNRSRRRLLSKLPLARWGRSYLFSILPLFLLYSRDYYREVLLVSRRKFYFLTLHSILGKKEFQSGFAVRVELWLFQLYKIWGFSWIHYVQAISKRFRFVKIVYIISARCKETIFSLNLDTPSVYLVCRCTPLSKEIHPIQFVSIFTRLASIGGSK